jgi:hypothetical protein
VVVGVVVTAYFIWCYVSVYVDSHINFIFFEKLIFTYLFINMFWFVSNYHFSCHNNKFEMYLHTKNDSHNITLLDYIYQMQIQNKIWNRLIQCRLIFGVFSL